MAVYKNKASQKLAIYAYDTAADESKTGDSANITAQISLDGAATAATNDANPTELDATDAPGIYLFDLTQAETNADLIVLSAVSSTSGIIIEPLIIYTEPETRETDVQLIEGSDATDVLRSEGGWTNTEKSELRYMIGIDGTATKPATNKQHIVKATRSYLRK